MYYPAAVKSVNPGDPPPCPPLPPRGRRRGLVCKQQRKSTVASGGAVLHAAWMWTEGWRTEDGGRRWVSGTLERVGDDARD